MRKASVKVRFIPGRCKKEWIATGYKDNYRGLELNDFVLFLRNSPPLAL